jgi:hypothetical protein
MGTLGNTRLGASLRCDTRHPSAPGGNIANRACRNDLIANLGLTALIIGGGSFITAFAPPLFLLGIPAAAVSVLLGLTAIAVAVHHRCNKLVLVLPIGGTAVAATSLLPQVKYLDALIGLGR